MSPAKFISLSALLLCSVSPAPLDSEGEKIAVNVDIADVSKGEPVTSLPSSVRSVVGDLELIKSQDEDPLFPESGDVKTVNPLAPLGNLVEPSPTESENEDVETNQLESDQSVPKSNELAPSLTANEELEADRTEPPSEAEILSQPALEDVAIKVDSPETGEVVRISVERSQPTKENVKSREPSDDDRIKVDPSTDAKNSQSTLGDEDSKGDSLQAGEEVQISIESLPSTEDDVKSNKRFQQIINQQINPPPDREGSSEPATDDKNITDDLEDSEVVPAVIDSSQRTSIDEEKQEAKRPFPLTTEPSRPSSIDMESKEYIPETEPKPMQPAQSESKAEELLESSPVTEPSQPGSRDVDYKGSSSIADPAVKIPVTEPFDVKIKLEIEEIPDVDVVSTSTPSSVLIESKENIPETEPKPIQPTQSESKAEEILESSSVTEPSQPGSRDVDFKGSSSITGPPVKKPVTEPSDVKIKLETEKTPDVDVVSSIPEKIEEDFTGYCPPGWRYSAGVCCYDWNYIYSYIWKPKDDFDDSEEVPGQSDEYLEDYCPPGWRYSAGRCWYDWSYISSYTQKPKDEIKGIIDLMKLFNGYYY